MATQRTRRQFLQDSFSVAAALTAAPMFSDLAAGQSTSANDKLLCAVIGCNGRGGDHISAYAGRKDVEIAYIVDIDPKAGEKGCSTVEKRTGRRPKWVKDMREVFDDKLHRVASKNIPFCKELEKNIELMFRLKNEGIIDFVQKRSRYVWQLDIYRASR